MNTTIAFLITIVTSLVGAAAVVATQSDTALAQKAQAYYKQNPQQLTSDGSLKMPENKLKGVALKSFLKLKRQDSCQVENQCPQMVIDDIGGGDKILRLVHKTKENTKTALFNLNGESLELDTKKSK